MKKLFDKITKDSYFLKGTIGLTLCLFSIYGALNTGVVSSFITWVIAFLFGWLLYVFYLIIFLIGVRFIFAKKEFKLHWGITISGIVILFFGCLIIITNNKTGTGNDDMLTFNNFNELFSKSVQGFPKVKFNDELSNAIEHEKGLLSYLKPSKIVEELNKCPSDSKIKIMNELGINI